MAIEFSLPSGLMYPEFNAVLSVGGLVQLYWAWLS